MHIKPTIVSTMPGLNKKLLVGNIATTLEKRSYFQQTLEVLNILLPALGTDSYSVRVPHLFARST